MILQFPSSYPPDRGRERAPPCEPAPPLRLSSAAIITAKLNRLAGKSPHLASAIEYYIDQLLAKKGGK